MKQGRTKEPQSYRLSSSSRHDESGVDGGDDCGGGGGDDDDGGGDDVGDANWEWHLSMLHPYSPCWKKGSCRNQGCIGWSFFRERSGVKS